MGRRLLGEDMRKPYRVVLERAVVEPLGDIRGLLLDCDEDVAHLVTLVVEALGQVVIPCQCTILDVFEAISQATTTRNLVRNLNPARRQDRH